MAKKSYKDTNGTSYHDTTISATVNQLTAAFGEPYNSNTGEDKVNFVWDMETEDGEVFTIYDWKEYRKLGLDETIEWHIGGYSREITERAADEVEEILRTI